MGTLLKGLKALVDWCTVMNLKVTIPIPTELTRAGSKNEKITSRAPQAARARASLPPSLLPLAVLPLHLEKSMSEQPSPTEVEQLLPASAEAALCATRCCSKAARVAAGNDSNNKRRSLRAASRMLAANASMSWV